MLTLWNGFDRLFDDELSRMRTDRMATRPRFNTARYGSTSFPRVNVLDTEAALVVSAEVPGFAPDDVEVTVHDGVLALVGRVEEAEEQEGTLVYRQRHNLSFKRTFTLNTDVDVEKVTAVVKDGLLTVTLPKAEAVKPRQIAVTSAD